MSLYDWYISKGWKAHMLTAAYKVCAGSEVRGSFVVSSHPALFIPMRSDKGKLLDYGFVPKDTWAGEQYDAPAHVIHGTKTHPWYKRIAMDITPC